MHLVTHISNRLFTGFLLRILTLGHLSEMARKISDIFNFFRTKLCLKIELKCLPSNHLTVYYISICLVHASYDTRNGRNVTSDFHAPGGQNQTT